MCVWCVSTSVFVCMCVCMCMCISMCMCMCMRMCMCMCVCVCVPVARVVQDDLGRPRRLGPAALRLQSVPMLLNRLYTVIKSGIYRINSRLKPAALRLQSARTQARATQARNHARTRTHTELRDSSWGALILFFCVCGGGGSVVTEVQEGAKRSTE